jgi:DNA-binding FrmR family transcriptional regulator
MDCKFTDGRLFLSREEGEKKPLLQRLNRIEGQVRGLRSMIEQDRHCLDEVQQVNAITAAMREVALEVISQHLTAGLTFASREHDSEAALADLMGVLRAAMRRG